MTDTTPIDAVITWVDGTAADHNRQRKHFMLLSSAPLHENAINPHRWVDSDEILFCLRSIETHAPWLRYIWIVVDETGPDLSALSDALRAKVRLVRHPEIFGGFEAALPTFNSLAIESLLWRIDGLSERFLYFNDDVFLTAPLDPSDVFVGAAPVLRGRWVDYGAIDASPDAREDPAKFNHFMQINAARLLGFAPDHLFAAAHVVHPMRRSVMADLYAQHQTAFAANVGFKFRDLSQFLPQGLHNHACLAADQAVIETRSDHLHIRSGQGVEDGAVETLAQLRGLATEGTRFLCVNDLPQLERVIPEARSLIQAAVSG